MSAQAIEKRDALVAAATVANAVLSTPQGQAATVAVAVAAAPALVVVGGTAAVVGGAYKIAKWLGH